MKLDAALSGSTHRLKLERDGELLRAKVDDRSYNLIVREFADGGLLLIDANELHNCQVSNGGERPDLFTVTLRGSTYEITVVDAKRLRSAQTAGGHDHGEAQVCATMPGKVVRVLVEVGAEVEAGTGIVVVEAMKMQNELKTPKSGRVATLSAIVGETVNAGEVLAVIE
jgi:biotin carboxyl carrier protein